MHFSGILGREEIIAMLWPKAGPSTAAAVVVLVYTTSEFAIVVGGTIYSMVFIREVKP